ncbi:tetratricopeptide repeat protein [Sediminicola luteus]|uniref:Uncharacterized protein n=1 Tax=Sediminicola luteus TaxID=319238 RepID=A0A2A4G248_9FLAO|nr:tetratricopeptide repeat protein [Sediminicola luteus]PCE62511.1 hypothetical protein B7P33_17895 [Sediminicola luteus]
MKTTISIIAALAFTMVGFAQKNEIKAAQKAIKKGDFAAAKTALEGASSLIGAADDKTKALYYYTQGTALKGLSATDNSVLKDAVAAYKELMAVEEKSGKKKYSAMAQQDLQVMTGEVVNAAVADNNAKNFKGASEKLYMAYQMSPTDTLYLYHAANSAISGQDYEGALGYYNELKEIGYDGSGVKYTALNTASGKREEMDKMQRDLMIKSGTYKDPKDEKIPSKRSEIIKNIALIYTQLGQDEKALEAFKDARASYPGDVNLILSEANLHFKQGNKEKFKELMAEAIALEPGNADLHYNVGVINMEQGNNEEARKAYNKALEIDPSYVNAALNISTSYVNEGNELVNQMNELGSSRADIAKYDELKAKKDDLFNKGAQILEDSVKSNPDNQSLLTQLKNIYGALGDTENFMRVKKLLGE